MCEVYPSRVVNHLKRSIGIKTSIVVETSASERKVNIGITNIELSLSRRYVESEKPPVQFSRGGEVVNTRHNSRFEN